MNKALSTRIVAVMVAALAASVAPAQSHAQPQNQSQPQASPQVPPNELVREAVDNELKHANDRTERVRYRIHKVTPERDETKLYVETDAGTVARLIALGEKPLPPNMQSAEDARLQGLLDHPEQQRERQRKQKQDQDRVTRMVGALPQAFLYEYDGTEPGKNGDELIRLRFKPNPNYDPPTRELRVYQGMEGKLWIDSASHRIAKLHAQLFRDVDFGWGILGRLYKGGQFTIEQSNVGDGRWETTLMNLDFNGKIMMFKTLRIRETQTLSDVHPVAANMNLQQGIALLRSYDPDKNVVAQGASAPPARAQRH
jgi:hypothetical protein